MSKNDTIFFVVNKKEKKILRNNLKQIIGFRPKNIFLYETAFIHKSASIKIAKKTFLNNQRLEFLGDTILNSIVSDYLYKKFPAEKEGFLTKTRSKIVNTKKLAEISMVFNLRQFLVIKTNNELNNNSLCADTLEALIGAIYLDVGYTKTKKFIEKKIINKIVDVDELIKTETNHKSNLIELCQKKHRKIRFNTFEQDPETNFFVSKVFIDDKETAEGYGLNKKNAEQMAALKALNLIKPDYNNGKK